MEKILNEKMKLTFPEGFRELSDQELEQLNFYNSQKGFVFEDKSRHMMISGGFKKINWLAALVLNVKDIAHNSEKLISKQMEEDGYQFIEFRSHDAHGHTSQSFCFSYQAQDQPMYGESLVFSDKNVLYYVNLYSKLSRKDENLPVFDSIISEIEWL